MGPITRSGKPKEGEGILAEERMPVGGSGSTLPRVRTNSRWTRRDDVRRKRKVAALDIARATEAVLYWASLVCAGACLRGCRTRTL